MSNETLNQPAHQPENQPIEPIDDLKEGSLYSYKDGELHEIQIDHEDTLRKVKLTDEAFESVVSVQKQMRKLLDGYKPDITIVASALIVSKSKHESAATTVRDYVLQTMAKIS